MNRILFLLSVLGPLTIPFAGCVSQAQMNMQQALFAQEYRQLEDELFLAYQNLDRLERSNAGLRAQLEQESTGSANRENGDSPLGPSQTNPVIPNVAPISTEGMRPSEGLPGILQSPSSSRPRSQVRPLPQPVEQAQYLEPGMVTRPQRPTGHTTADLPIWRPTR